MIFEFNYSLVEAELENRYHHLHHADALKILELARLEFLKQINFSLESFLAHNLFLVISNLHVSYKREVHAGEIKVISKDFSVQGKELIIPQFLYNPAGKLAIEAKVHSMIMCANTKRAVYPEPEFVKAFTEV
jgi:YbgC/YbaW family acyl-CoA thioester hydrolase